MDFIDIQNIGSDGSYQNAGGLKKAIARGRAKRAKKLTKRAEKLTKKSEKVLGKKETPTKATPTTPTTEQTINKPINKTPFIIGGIVLVTVIVGILIIKK